MTGRQLGEEGLSLPAGHLSPLPSASTASLIAEQIRSAMVRGALAPGTRLGEEELGRRMVVSRGPVREALHRLVQEGVLIEVRNRGIFVPRLGADDLADVYLARRAVEGEVVRTLARSKANVREVEAVARKLEAAARGRRWSLVAELDQAFHRSLARTAGSPRLERMAGTLLVETRLGIVVLGKEYRPGEPMVGEHRRVLEAVARGDAALAQRRMAEHLEGAARRFGQAFAAMDAAAGATAGQAALAATRRRRTLQPGS